VSGIIKDVRLDARKIRAIIVETTSAILPRHQLHASAICPSTTYNDNTSSSACSYSICPNGCDYDGQGCPVSCVSDDHTGGSCLSQAAQSSCETSGCVWYIDHTDGIPHCDDAAHGTGTSVSSCPSGSESCDYNVCASGCEWDNQGCTIGCNTTPSSYCGDNVCDSQEDSYSCSVDCGSYCGDSACTDGETQESCPNDCGSPVFSCPSSTDVCDFNACPSGCEWDNQGCTTGCVTASPQDPSIECANTGGTWDGSTCEMPGTDSGVDPGAECANSGGVWDGVTCQISVRYNNFLAQTAAAAARLTDFIQGLFGR